MLVGVLVGDHKRWFCSWPHICNSAVVKSNHQIFIFKSCMQLVVDILKDAVIWLQHGSHCCSRWPKCFWCAGRAGQAGERGEREAHFYAAMEQHRHVPAAVRQAQVASGCRGIDGSAADPNADNNQQTQQQQQQQPLLMQQLATWVPCSCEF